MSEALLVTKHHCPAPASDLMLRPQVTGLLEAGLRGRLTLISAPAGFGKTTLVAQWLTLRMKDEDESALLPASSFIPHPSSFAWLSLEADDNVLLRFWAYVIAALQTVAPDVGRVAQAALQAPQPLPIEPVLTTLVNDLATLTTPLLLVLDDYHLITLPAIHRTVDLLLDHLPPTLRLVISTREDPPLALARLRARGQLTEIRAAELRFSASEAQFFLNTALAFPLTEPDSATLVARTEGWITGLRLAVLSLQHAADQHGFVDAFSASDRFITDYLVDEILSRQPAHRKAFLLQTAGLNRLCGPLCDAVLGIEQPIPAGQIEPSSYSQQILAELDRANLFLVPLDRDRRWFRYHHLFAEFLRLRLREAAPERVATLYQRAGAWCVAHGLPREALGYALAAGDDGAAADLIETLIPESLGRETPDEALRWLAALPAPLLRQRPGLCVQFAWALTFVGRMAEAAEYLTAAEASVAADAELMQQIAGPVAAHRAYLHFFAGAFPSAHQEAARALTLLPPGAAVLRARAAVVLSSVLRFAGQLQAAETVLLPLRDAIATTSVYSATFYYVTLGEIQQERGQLHQALATFDQALTFAVRATGRPDTPFTGFAYIAISHVRRAWNDLPAAAAALARGLELCRTWHQADALAIGLVELAELEQCRGEFALAQHALDELRQIVATMGSPWGHAQVQVAQARLDLARGDLAAVEHWVRTSGVSADAVGAHTGFDDLQIFGQTLVARGDFASAVRLFERLVEQFRPTGSVGRLLPALVWRARALAEFGRREEALTVLDEALALGQPGGYVRVFVAAGLPIATLLEAQPPTRNAQRDPLHGYVAQILAAFQTEGHSAPVVPPTVPASQALPEPLNARELTILRLMAAGLSNQAIGAELSLSVNTIRWYASQIFAKLTVSSRSAAVARARACGLLP